ncbi:MAG: hypothetical protein ACRDQ4_22815 [Pseudonocardiaceae bacterium]
MSVSARDTLEQVVRLRIRIEQLAAAVFDRACQPAVQGCQSNAQARLLFALAGLPEEKWMPRYRLIRLGRYAHERTSDFLHSRANAANLSQTVIDEWRAVVEELEEIIKVPRNL